MDQDTLFYIFAALFAASEVLAQIPWVKSNSVCQLVFAVIKRLAGKTVVLLAVLLMASSAMAAYIDTFTWEALSDPAVTGYKIYLVRDGLDTDRFLLATVQGRTTIQNTVTVSPASSGIFVFKMTAFSATGESAMSLPATGPGTSTEIAKITVPLPVPLKFRLTVQTDGTAGGTTVTVSP